MDDLLAEFVAETREMLAALGSELVVWEADPSDKERLDQIFRFAHTVKGSCGFFDFPRLEKLSHAAEEALDEVRRGTRYPNELMVSAILAVIDRISDYIDAIDSDTQLPGDGDDALIAALAADADDAEIAALQKSGFDSDDKLRTVSVQRSIRLPVTLLDRMMSGVSDLVLARNSLARSLRDQGGHLELDGPFERMSTILDDVRDAVTRMRMQRIGCLFAALPRMVRDLAQELGKQVMIDVEGEDVELDREMIETIRDPLTHLIRNAMDHGIETPAERRSVGKREIGTLRIQATQSGNQIYLTVHDDGRGLDEAKLASKAMAAGIVTEDELAGMSMEEKHSLIFSAGLSTADEITAVSGRGVGMDVVRANVEKIGGSVKIMSQRGSGTAIIMRLPLTLSIIDTLSVSNAGQRFAMPRSNVEEVILGSDEDLRFQELGGGRFIDFRGQRIPCLFLCDILGVPSEVPVAERTFIVARYTQYDCIAFAVDAVHDHEDAVIKPIAPALTSTGLYTGATLLDDGTPVLALDIASIGLRSGMLIGRKRISDEIEAEESSVDKDQGNHPSVMLFVGFDGGQRCLPMADLARIETIDAAQVERHGGVARAVIDGAMHRLAGLGPDDVPEGKLRLLRMNDAGQDAYYAIRAIIDVVESESEVSPGCDIAEISGYVIIGGKPVPMIDATQIMASVASAERKAEAER